MGMFSGRGGCPLGVLMAALRHQSGVEGVGPISGSGFKWMDISVVEVGSLREV
jgi:hypothetical protein